jgi:hypothetical protein
MSGRDSLNKRKRLVMPRREEALPREWLRNKDTPFEARIVSIHTGTHWFFFKRNRRGSPYCDFIRINKCTEEIQRK